MSARASTDATQSASTATPEPARRSVIDRATAFVDMHWLLVPGVLLLLIVFVWPIARLLVLAFAGDGFAANFSGALTGASGTVLWRSIVISVIVTVVSLIVGFAFAHVAARVLPPRAGQLLITAVLVSLFLSIVVRGYAWLAILGRGGMVSDFFEGFGMDVALVPSRAGVVIGMAQYTIPLMILPIYSAMVRYDARFDLAAASLGARKLRTFLRVYIPIIVSGIGAGCAIVFTVSLGYYVLPSILGGANNQMIGSIIAQKATKTLETESASAISIVLLAISLLSFLVIFRATRRDYGA